jgi:hypothetical protein
MDFFENNMPFILIILAFILFVLAKVVVEKKFGKRAFLIVTIPLASFALGSFIVSSPINFFERGPMTKIAFLIFVIGVSIGIIRNVILLVKNKV